MNIISVFKKRFKFLKEKIKNPRGEKAKRIMRVYRKRAREDGIRSCKAFKLK